MKTYTTQINRRFQSSIRRGTGEAYLLMKQYPNIDFSKEIIDASLFNYAYDGQCEDSRASYLLELTELSKQKDVIRVAVLEALSREKDDIWSLTQLFDFCLLYAKRGDKDARQAIYNRFYNNIIDCSNWTGGTEIIELDGIEGMFHIADKVGSYLIGHSDDKEDDFLISHCQELYPELDVFQELEVQALKNLNIRCYIDNVKETRVSLKNERTNRKVYTNIIEEIEQRQFVYLENRSLTEQEIRQIADRFLEEQNKSIKAKFLYAFKYVEYPYDYTYILQLAQQRGDKYRLQEYAINALRNIQAGDIREFALEKIISSRYPALYVNILQNNYREGDEALLTRIIEKFKDEDVVEALASSYINVYQKNKTQSCQRPLEALYYKSNCGICRHSIVNILIDNNVLSDMINNEIQYDCDEDTRALYLRRKEN